MSASAFPFAGVVMRALECGALHVPAWRALIVADLHLEKGSRFARHGALLPPYDSRASLDALAACLDAVRPDRVICLGDSFHDTGGPGRLPADQRARLIAMMAGRDWLWVIGNHDRQAPAAIGGRTCQDVTLGGVVLRHQADAAARGLEISGHFHPKARVRIKGRRITGRCFVSDGSRLIVPAFGAYTGGLDVFDPALACLLAPRFGVHFIGPRRVHALSSTALCLD